MPLSCIALQYYCIKLVALRVTSFSFSTQAYVFDVEDEYAESDIPTTLIRSKADCPGIEVSDFLEIRVFHFVGVIKGLVSSK